MPQKLKEAVEAHVGLTLLAKKDEDKPFLPYKTKLQIATRLRRLAEDNKTFESEKMKLAEKYGVPKYKAQTKEQIAAENKPEIESYSIESTSPHFDEFKVAFDTLANSEAVSEKIIPLAIDSLGENSLPVGLLLELQDAGVLAKEEETK